MPRRGLARRVVGRHLRGVIYPPVLRPGDRVALVAPAGPADDETIQRAVRRCEGLGLTAVPGDAVRAKRDYLAGTDVERARDLTRAVAGDAAAIWAIRGGYGTVRTLEHVDLTPLRERPRPFIGFSDNTVVHLALLREGLVSFHGPHAGDRDFSSTTEAVFRAVVMSTEPAGLLPVPNSARPATVTPGVAEGPLVGGNLALLAATCGTRYQPDTRGSILFIEDVGEALYRVDRMIMQLRLAGVFDDVAAVALGRFRHIDGAGDDADAALGHLFAELLGPLGVPVAFGLPFGHDRENWTLPLGVPARLDADAGTLELREGATSEKGTR